MEGRTDHNNLATTGGLFTFARQRHLALNDNTKHPDFLPQQLRANIQNNIAHTAFIMSYNPRMSIAPRASAQTNQRTRQQDESDAFMTLVCIVLPSIVKIQQLTVYSPTPKSRAASAT